MTKHYYNIKLDIPQDADSAKYFIPKGYTAKLEDGVLIIEPKKSEDERIREELIGHCKDLVRKNQDDKVMLSIYEPWLAYLEKQKDSPMPEDTLIFQKGVAEGRRLEREEKQTDLPPGFYFIDLNGHKYYSKEFRYGDMKMKIVEDAQKEQKPEWSKEDEINRQIAIGKLEGTEVALEWNVEQRVIKWLKSLPLNLKKKNEDVAKLCSNEWSEEDEKMRQHIISDLREFKDYETDEEIISDYEDEISWLKSLKNRGNFPKSNTNSPHWKPSEEQMEALKVSCSYWQGLTKEVPKTNELESLYNDLKKLM